MATTTDPVAAFIARHRALLIATYNAAWQAGVNNFSPRQRTGPPSAHTVERAGLTAAISVLLGRRNAAYTPPGNPDPARRARALRLALRSLDLMAQELGGLVPTPAQLALAQAAVANGTIPAGDVSAYALAIAAADWAQSNVWRLNLGDSVAWAGEQDGYAQAASADGMLFEWTDAGDAHVCPDCIALSDMPPMPYEEWPATPGDGSTECFSGCRCDLTPTDMIPTIAQLAGRAPERLRLLARLAGP